MTKNLTMATSMLWTSPSDPGVSETSVEQGNFWFNTNTLSLFQCKNATAGIQVWEKYIKSVAGVVDGGTGAATLTSHSLLVGNGTSAVTQLAVGASNALLMGQSSSDPLFTTSGTPYVSGISFDSGSNVLNSFTGFTSFTPVVAGTGTAGTATYSTQVGKYAKVGPLVFGWINLVWSATTGAGNTIITGLPFSANAAVVPVVNFQFESITLPIGGLFLNGKITGTQISIVSPITAAVSTALPLPAAGTLQCSFFYSI